MRKKIIMPVFLLAALFFITACEFPGSLTARKGNNTASAQNAAKQAEQLVQSENQNVLENTVYMVVKNDISNYQITLMNVSDGSRICYEYTEGTEFFDKYGDYALSEEFSEGRLAVITRLNSNDTLGAIAFTDKTWSYEDVRNYSIDKEKDIITIADANYKCSGQLTVFSGGEEADLFEVGRNDVLDLYGIGRTVYSIVVKSGHGTLALANTGLFEGGWMNLGTQVYTVVQKDMEMEVPEGIYRFSVANDGYGDSDVIRIERDQTTTIDLNDYKGEGPKMCRLYFNVSVDNAQIQIDGEKINASKPLDVRYGVHMLSVRAEGYNDWNKQLVINSPTANIDILLSTQEASADSSTGSDSSGSNTSSTNSGNSSNSQNTQAKAGSLAGSYAGSNAGSSSSGTASSGNSSAAKLADSALGSSLSSIITGGKSTDYLDTLADLVKSLDKLNSASSKNGD